MAFDGTVNGIDHVESASRGAAVFDVPWFDVKRKEFRRQPTFLHALDAGAIRSGRSSTQIVIVVGHRRRDVVMRVDDDRAPVDLQRPPPEPFVSRLTHCGYYGGRYKQTE